MNCLELRVNNIMERGDGGLVWGDLPAEREFESTSKWWAFRRLKWVCCFSFSEWFPMVILTIHNCSYSRGFWSFVFNVFLTWLILFIHKIPPPHQTKSDKTLLRPPLPSDYTLGQRNNLNILLNIVLCSQFYTLIFFSEKPSLRNASEK